jgi:hypothetical protein
LPDLGGKVVQQVDTFEGAAGDRPAEVCLGVDKAGRAFAARMRSTQRRTTSKRSTSCAGIRITGIRTTGIG